MREVRLQDHPRLAGVGHVDGGEILMALVGQPHDAAPVVGHLDGHAFADVAEPRERVLGQEFQFIELVDHRCAPHESLIVGARYVTWRAWCSIAGNYRQ
jgi:hypothetical protein